MKQDNYENFEGMNQAVDEFESEAKEVADQAEHKMRRGISSASKMADQLSHKAQGVWEDLRHKAQSSSQEAQRFVKKYPLSTVAGAAAISFVAGMIAKRSR